MGLTAVGNNLLGSGRSLPQSGRTLIGSGRALIGSGRTRRDFMRMMGFAPLGYYLLRTTKLATMNLQTFYVGTYTNGDSEGIYQCRMNTETGALEVVGTTGDIANPSFLAVDPNGNHLYSVSETSEYEGESGGGVYAYAIDGESHALRALNARPSHGGAPCYISVSPGGGHVLVANYSGGNVAILPIESDGSLSPASDIEQHEGSSINEQRQAGPHAHCIITDAAGRRAFAADLGIDRVIVYRLDSGELTPAGHAVLAAGAGPRHITFNPDESRAYVINELDSTVTAFEYDGDTLEEAQTIGTLPEGFDGENSTADIHVSSDGRFVYGSNRGHDSIVVFSIDVQSGLLTPTGHQLAVPTPVCVRFLT